MSKTAIQPRGVGKTNKSKLLKLLGSSRLSIAAVLIVTGIAGYGAYQFVYSSAYTISNYAAMKDACRAQFPPSKDKPTNNNQQNRLNCIAKVDKLKIDELAAKCAELKRHVSGENCGACYSAFQDAGGNPGGQCVPINQPGGNPSTGGGGGSGSGGGSSNGETASSVKARCAENKRVYVANNGVGYCGSCYAEFEDLIGDPNNGVCTRKAGTAGGSNPGGTSQNPTPDGKAAVKARCAANFREYVANSGDGYCGSCLSGYKDGGGTPGQGQCVLKTTAAAPGSSPNPVASSGIVCSGTNMVLINGKCEKSKQGSCTSDEQYDAATNNCPCKNGKVKNNGKCPNNNGSISSDCSRANEILINGQCVKTQTVNPDAVKTACEQAGRKYNNDKNQCGDCKNNLALVNGTCRAVSAEERQKVKQDCDIKHLQYDSDTNSCSNDCKKDYIKERGTCVEITSLDTDAIKALCAKKHLQYDSRAKNCSSNCAVGYLPDADGKCVSPDKLKTACKAMNLEYNDQTNTCTNKCVAGYKKNADGKCIDKSGSADSMTERVCRVLGRSWTQEPPKAAKCSNKCLDGSGTVVAGTTDLVSYCKGGGLSVSAGINSKDCQSLNRVYIDSIGACSARCRGGFFLKDGLCKAINTQVNLNDGQPECPLPLETQTVTDEDGNETEEEYCPEPETCASALITKTTYNEDDGYQTVDNYCADGDSCSVAPVNDEVTLPNGATQTRVNFCSDEDDSGCSVDLQTKTITDEDGTITVIPNYCPDDEAPILGPDGETTGGRVGIEEVDQLVDEELCSQLGRVWVPEYEDNGITIAGGCSTEECLLEGASIQFSDDSVYCEGNVERISEEACNEAGREWIDEVEGCAELLTDIDFSGYDESEYAELGYDDTAYSEDDVYFGDASETDTDSYVTNENTDPISKATSPVLNAKACKAPTTTYVHRSKRNGGDRCRKPTVTERFKSVTSGAGKAIGGITSLPSRLICNAQIGKTWQGGCKPLQLPNAKQGGDARRVDSFGTAFNVNTITNKRVTCAKLRKAVNDKGAQQFNCFPRAECKAAGGFYKISYLYNGDTNKVQSARVCWGVSS